LASRLLRPTFANSKSASSALVNVVVISLPYSNSHLHA
jgi:hypothetical protein